jgi:outer membrane protein TolC
MKVKLLLFIYISAITVSFPQQLLTVDNAVGIALKNNFSITIAGREKDISINNAVPGNAGFLPTLSASGTYTESDNNTRQELYTGAVIDRKNAESNNFTGSINLNWTVFDGLGMFASYDALKQLKEIGEINYRSAVENNIAGVLTTYYDLVRKGVVLEVISRSIKISEERVKIAQNKREVGSASKFDMLQAQTDLNEDRSLYLNAELAYEQSKAALNKLLGRNPAEDFNVIDTIIVNKTLQLDDIKLAAVNDNTDLQLAQKNRNVAEADLRLSKSALFPEISLFGSYNVLRSETQAGQVRSNKNNGFSYGVSASLSIFNGLNTRRQIENAQIANEIAGYEFDSTKINIEASLQNTYKAYQNSLKLIELENENLNITEENVGIAMERLRLGNITQLEFREAQVNLLDAQSRLVNAQYEAKSAETELLRLSGGLVKK